MATTGSTDGHQRLATNQDPTVQECGAEKEKEAGDVNSTVAENGDHRKEAAADVSPSCSDPHPSPSSTDQTFTVTASVPDDEPNSSSETGTGPEVKTEETDKENVSVTDENNSEGEDTDMDKTSDAQKDLKENAAPRSCTLRVSTADDLDEMMDIGTVDQIDQEAQMEKEEGWETPRDVQRTPSSGSSPTGQVEEDEEEQGDVKPSVLTPPKAETQEETTSSGRTSLSPPPKVNGMRTRSQTAKSSRSTSPPLVKVKDEPEDEEYDRALVSSTSDASVKDEPTTAREDLGIGSVYSVTQSTSSQKPPVLSSSHMSCFNCKKNLLKGQTAFQRRGCSALFCSTSCLATALPNQKSLSVICFNCQKAVLRPQDIILSPDAKGAMKEFCSQSCLSAFNYKKRSSATKKPEATKAIVSKGPHCICSVCNRICVSKHEVVLNEAVHKLCSDLCFTRFRSAHNLSVASCANCGSFCHGKSMTLRLEGTSKTLCNLTCLAKYKEKNKTTQPCSMCRVERLISEMVDNKNNEDDSVNLFCSSSCVMAFMVQTVSASGARVNCDHCGKNAVPAYHLAMSDTSIRNFCSLPCVMTFQENFKKSQKQMNIFTKLPVGSSQSPESAPVELEADLSKDADALNCSQCGRHITFTPEVIHLKDKMVFVCSPECSQEYKNDNFVTSPCEYCKAEKITTEVRRINNKDCHFCSEGCKLLFKHDLAKTWGKHCPSCTYCHCTSKKVVTAQYGGATEEFCCEECRSKYTMLFCHLSKCDMCGTKGKLKQSLPLLSEVKYFCDQTCLLQFCVEKSSQGELSKDPAEDTPVIANVMSLASENATASEQSSRQAGTTTKPLSKNSTQTETVEPQSPKILKNKALLCRPLVKNKGVSCRLQTSDAESQTVGIFPKMMVIPVPVPIYVPVPMAMYSQLTPQAVALPLPLPVPLLLPVTTDNAERIIETIQEIKEKIPADPYEADIILMAEMVAEQSEPEVKEKKAKVKVERKSGRRATAAAEDRTGAYGDDLDTEDLATFLNNFEDNSSDTGLRPLSRPHSREKSNSVANASAAVDSQPVAPPPMDVETDFNVETLEKMARLREHSQRSPSPPPTTSRRRQANKKGREKRGRKAQESKAADKKSQKGSALKAAATDLPKLQSRYGVDAWKRWMQWRQSQPNLVKPRFGSRPMELKEDLLKCTTTELSYGLCCFISEVKRPNGEPYTPDSLFYLCLGIQQYLFEHSRVENIFTDRFYSRFSAEFTEKLRDFQPLVTDSGYIHSLVEEEFLWECKQLGAYSPIVLLNTLLFFCCKYFGFTTVEQHRQLSFAHVMRCTKNNLDNTRTTFLRFYPPISTEAESDPETPAKKRKDEEAKEDILEMVENQENPLRCPVRLYEFYLSKCSESVKQRTNVFYLLPERCCVPNSPLWFSSTALDDTTMEAMLTRILTVRELHVHLMKQKSTRRKTSRKSSYRPNTEEEEEEEELSE
ncbi:zinc finger MYM-type protein 4-like isoform X2 [Cynoglossus semilaevis]|uniref:Zinc finger MYM-type protein 4-like n=1 Tax=Cynoglossus semilaevis TaxID=244447 RepID=A0A3P8VCM0_CYNSE|nr:zinc finger MYM-type protein 4-like isoform X2 [Cynoglossus semilaevis]